MGTGIVSLVSANGAVIQAARTEVVAVVSTTETSTVVAVTTEVSDTTSVCTLVAVRVVVTAGAVLPTVTVTVSASTPRQLQAWESLDAGWWTRFLLARVGQLTVAEVDRDTARFSTVGMGVKNDVVVIVATVKVSVATT